MSSASLHVPADASIVDCKWLQRNINEPGLRVLDASWYLPTLARNCVAEFEAERIPGAVYFSIDESSEQNTKLPHMLATEEHFARYCSRLGIRNEDTLVIYDTSGVYSSPRAWWMFRVYGHKDVVVLDGGLKKWKLEGHATESGPRAPLSPSRYVARLDTAQVVSIGDVVANITHQRFQMIDARPKGRFEGTEPEPRPGIDSGHVPGASNIPFDAVVNPTDGTLLHYAELRALFERAGALGTRPVVTTCGSATTAATLNLCLTVLGRSDMTIYDGAWTEYAGDKSRPNEKGASRV